MDKNTKNSLLFGAAVGGLFALLRGAKEKASLTDTQRKDLGAATKSFDSLKTSLDKNVQLAPIYAIIKEKEAVKDYDAILSYLGDQISQSREDSSEVENFNDRLEYILSSRFTSDRANPKTHEIQSFFLPLKRFPSLARDLFSKRIAILTLIQKAFMYIKAAEVSDFKPDDKQLLQSLVSEFQILQKEMTNQLARLSK
jgi:hypothetical protein